MFFDIPKFQAEDSLTAQSLRTAYKDKTAFMIQCYVSSLCNSDTRPVIPPSHCTCNNDRYRRTPKFLFRLKTRGLTRGSWYNLWQGARKGICSFCPQWEIRAIKHARLLPKLPSTEIPRPQVWACSQAAVLVVPSTTKVSSRACNQWAPSAFHPKCGASPKPS